MTTSPGRSLTQYLVASSLDGFIADENDNLDWLLTMPGGDDEANPYPAFIERVGALAMGATTYEWILRHDPGGWAYADRPTWVFTHRELPVIQGANVRFTAGDISTEHAAMVEAAGDRNVWLVGGGELVGQFLDADLLDELIVSVTPMLLGRGAPLLPRRRTQAMRLLSATPSPADTFVHLHYTLR
ncbi:MAG TPA: dihydrofolate reductase family protein [Marmoricola sp.]|nr:dihydrofolate reductase family protein [Marmoricola sp.]